MVKEKKTFDPSWFWLPLFLRALQGRLQVMFPCRFFQEGRCNAGRQCKFSHDSSVLKKPVAKPPCRYFLSGHCLAGSSCEFSHLEKRKVKPAVAPASAASFCPKPTAGLAIPSKSLQKEGRSGSQAMAQTLGDGEDLTYEPEVFTIGMDADLRAAAKTTTTSYVELARRAAGNGDDRLDVRLLEMNLGVEPDDSAVSEDQLAARQQIQLRIRESEGLECGICLECVSKKGEQFGVLSGCKHTFCLGCIREWRAVEYLQKDVKRSCPQCRCESHLVIPSSYVPAADDEKAQLVEGYKTRLSRIPCKHFNLGLGECPFGSSCFYEHRHRDGTLSAPGPPRLRMTEDGDIISVARPRLCDLIDIAART